jgi:hypothetical protein
MFLSPMTLASWHYRHLSEEVQYNVELFAPIFVCKGLKEIRMYSSTTLLEILMLRFFCNVRAASHINIDRLRK